MTEGENDYPSVTYGDSSLRRARSAALTVHRTVIHSRRLRFAYSRRESRREQAVTPTGAEKERRMADGHPYGVQGKIWWCGC